MAKQHTKQNLSSNQQWQAHIRAQEKSGLSRAEYCRQHELSYHAMTYWLRKRNRLATSRSTLLVPVPVTPTPAVPSPHQEGSGIKILLGNGLAIEVAEHFSTPVLAGVLSVLEER